MRLQLTFHMTNNPLQECWTCSSFALHRLIAERELRRCTFEVRSSNNDLKINDLTTNDFAKCEERAKFKTLKFKSWPIHFAHFTPWRSRTITTRFTYCHTIRQLAPVHIESAEFLKSEVLNLYSVRKQKKDFEIFEIFEISFKLEL